ncbi:MAG: CsgG/HfaB family protein [Gemmatimonadota bacterium]|jgi:curli biogenesis system outer membrane secretion channel CsgG
MRRQGIALTLAALAASSVLVVGSARAQEATDGDVPTVAVLDFSSFMMGDAGMGSVNLGKAITAMLVTEFSNRPGIRVIERAQLNEMLREQDLVLSGRVDESSAIEIGKLLGAQYILIGQASSIADNLRMDIRAVDVETSEIVAVLKMSDETSELLSVVVALADQFGEQLNLVPPSERPEVESIPVQATIAFSRAVDYEDRGEIEQAIEQYERTLEIHPNHRDAQRALERLRGES